MAASVGTLRLVYNGMLSCFFQGFSTCLLRSICNAHAMRLRVKSGMITSSIQPKPQPITVYLTT
jgi:hypothetical protein